MRALSIDAGSSSVRAALCDAAGEMIPGSLAQLDVELTAEAGGLAQIDAARMRDAIERAIDLVLRHPAASEGISVVGMTTFWHSLVAVNRTGEALTPVLTWADTRSENEANFLRNQLDGHAVHQRTGCVLHPSYLPAKIRWLHQHQPALRATSTGYLSFAQHCTSRWLGTEATSVSMASGSGLFNHTTGGWDEELLAALDLRVGALGGFLPDPEMLPPVVAEYARRWPALAGVPWRAPIGDGASSNVGSGCVGDDRVALMVGTSGAMRRCAPDRSDESVGEGLWRYRLDRDFAVTGGALSDGGSVYEWLRETLTLPDDETLERELAERSPGQHGLIVLPFWAGERSLGWVGDATAIVAGLRRHTTPLDIFQAALEAVAYRFAALHDALRAGGDMVIASGGGLRESPAWLQMMADALGREIVASDVVEASLRGAALVALRDIGAIGSLPRATGGEVYRPREDRVEAHRRARSLQQTLYDREIGRRGENLLARQTR